MRDLSYPQFLKALARHGIVPTGLLGYMDLGNGYHVHPDNAGTSNLRRQLAYLIKRKKDLSTKSQEPK